MLENGHNEAALALRHDMAKHELYDLVEVVFVLLAERQDARFDASPEQLLRLLVARKQAGDDVRLVRIEATLVAINGGEKRGELRAEHSTVLSANVVLHEVLDELLEAVGRELGSVALGLRQVDGRANGLLELGGHAARERGENSGHLGEGKFGIVEDGDEVLEGGYHYGLVVVAIEDVVEDVQEVVHALVRLVPDNARCSQSRKETFEWLCVLHASGVIEGEDAQDVTGLKADTGLLDELYDAVLGGDERHIHLHDLHDYNEQLESGRTYIYVPRSQRTARRH